MAKKKRGQSGRKAGSVIDNIQDPAAKKKPKKQKKQSKGKHKK